MKHLKKYTSIEAYEAEKDTLPKPNVTYVVGDKVYYKPNEDFYLDVSRLGEKKII